MQKTISSLVNKNSLKAIFNFFYRISISFWLLIVTVVCLGRLVEVIEDHRWLPITFLITGIVIALKIGAEASKEKDTSD